MLIKDLKKCREFTAGDKSILRELLHPDKTDININYSLAHASVDIGKKTLPHKLKSSEVYYILRGEGVMYIDADSAKVREGQAVYIPPHTIQCILNTGSSALQFICIVNPAWQEQDEEIIGL